MATRVTRAAAAAAAAQVDIDTAASMPLPSSPAIAGLENVTNTYLSSPLASKRSTSGTKTAAVHIAEDFDAPNAASPRPGSPAACAVLKPSGKAKQLLNRERNGMRASSNKENMKPAGDATSTAANGTNVVASGSLGDAPTATEIAPAGDAVETLAQHFETVESNTTEPPLAKVTDEDTKDETAQKTMNPPPKPGHSRRAPEAPTRRASTAPGAKPAASERRTSTIIPHSKPRPMSMSFPTPPPPAKSTKTPTRPTFALPGEAGAARLKAAKEARLAASAAAAPAPAEPEKRPAFKARPAPKMSADDGAKVRATASSRLREELQFPERRRASTALAHSRRESSARAPTPAAQSRQSLASSSMAAGRPSMGGAARSDKGREVYGRAAAGLEAARKAQRDKEDAARRARAEAAERGRAASKEWAERQRKLAASKKAAEAVAE